MNSEFCAVKPHLTAAYKPSTNRIAERMVLTFKKALNASTDNLQLTIDKFLFNYRVTPLSTTGKTHSELMFGRKLHSTLDLLWLSSDTEEKVHMQQDKQNVIIPQTLGKFHLKSILPLWLGIMPGVTNGFRAK